MWAETRASCGQAFERVGQRWEARPGVVNCYQVVPDGCGTRGSYRAPDGSLFWIHGTSDHRIPYSVDDTGVGPIVLDAPVRPGDSARTTIPFSAGDVWGTSATDVFAVGARGMITHFDGTTWTQEAADTDADLVAIRGGAGLVLAVGAHGTILSRSSGGRWVRESIPTTVGLHDVAFTSDGWFAVGDGGVVVRRGG